MNLVRPIDDEYLLRKDVFCINVKSFFASVEAVRRRTHSSNEAVFR
ncbi:hypothetical protein [Domibacillus robiginosus]|nr:hypothetical protein [Domibacillus robiginosus]